MTVADSIRAAAASLQREIVDIDEGIRRLQERRARLVAAAEVLAEHAMAAEGGGPAAASAPLTNGHDPAAVQPSREAASVPRHDPYAGGRRNGATAAVRELLSSRPGVWLTATDVRRMTGLPGSAVSSALSNLRRSGEVTEREMDHVDMRRRGGGRGARLEYRWRQEEEASP